MLTLKVEWTSAGLNRRMKALEDGLKIDSPGMQKLRTDFKNIVTEDHHNRIRSGVDTQGKGFAKLAKSTLARKGRGPGGPLNPTGTRFIKNFRALWRKDGGGYVLTMRYENLPFSIFHETGAKRGKWVLPQRKTMGVGRTAHAKLDARQRKFVDDMTRRGSIT